jgi:hypothetical protein
MPAISRCSFAGCRREAAHGVFQSLSLGRAVIASDLGEQSELPAVAPKVLGGRSRCARADADRAVDHPSSCRRWSSAREFVERECSWSRVAQLCRVLSTSPAAIRASRRLHYAHAVRERRG